MLNDLPKQRVSLKEKEKNDFQWAKSSMDAYINATTYGSKGHSELLDLYSVYNGKLDETQYNYVINPYQTDQGNQRKFPARLRSYNIIKPVVDLFLGEHIKRPKQKTVVSKNGYAIMEKAEARKVLTKNILQQKFFNKLNEKGMKTGIESKETPDLAKAIEEFEQNYRDGKAIKAQSIIEFLEMDLRITDKFQEMFFDFLITGEVYSFKSVEFDEVTYERVSPLELDYDKSNTSPSIEDGDWAVRRTRMSVNEIIDRFRDLLTEKQIDDLEDPSTNQDGIHFPLFDDDGDMDRNKQHPVYHTVWKSLKKVGFLTYFDEELGMVNEEMVDEDYKFDESMGDIDISWTWINEIWEGYRIGERLHIGMQPFPTQRRNKQNISQTKLPYNGRKYSAVHAENTSLVKLGIPYQQLYNIFHYRLELSIAKNKDKIMLMEINAIPKKSGWDEEKFMYYADAAGFAFIDTSSEGDKGRHLSSFNQFQVLDMGLGQYIQSQFDLLTSIRMEWETNAGITPQRKGDIAPSSGKGVTERAVFQSSVISEELFRKFEQFEELDYQGLLDMGVEAFDTGREATFMNEDGVLNDIAIQEGEFQYTDLGIFFKNSGKELEKVSTLKVLAQQFAQNQSPSTVAEILDMDSFSNIKQKLQKMESQEKEFQKQLEQEKTKQEQMKLDAMKEDREDRQSHDSKENQLDRQKDILVKEMDGQQKLMDDDRDNDGIDDTAEYEKLQFEQRKWDEEMAQKKREAERDEKLKNRELDIKEKEVAAKKAQQQKSDSNRKK